MPVFAVTRGSRIYSTVYTDTVLLAIAVVQHLNLRVNEIRPHILTKSVAQIFSARQKKAAWLIIALP